MRSAILSSVIMLLSLGSAQAAYREASDCYYSCRRKLEDKQTARALELEQWEHARQIEMQEFEGIMQQGLRGLKQGVAGGCGHTCDCFTCGDVRLLSSGAKEITINHCKDGTISWMCCTGTDNGPCNTSCGSAKCTGQADGQFKVIVPGDATAFTINTHDGQTAGDADMNNSVCGGNGNQGGKCATKAGDVTAHCEITFNIASQCNSGPIPPRPVCEDETCIIDSDGLCDDDFCLPRTCFCVDTDTGAPLTAAEFAVFNSYGLIVGPVYASKEECECIQCGTCEGGGKGDPHLSNWKGEWVDYMGECDIKYLLAPLFDGKRDLEIAIRTTIRDWYSFIEATALRIGDEILEFDSFGNYVLNDVEGALTDDETEVPTLGGFPVHFNQENKKHTRLDVVLDESHNITFKSFKDWVSFQISPGAAGFDFTRSTGMMGTIEGELLARNGTDLSKDIDALAQDWQYQEHEPSLFRSRREPQWPNKCNLPTVSLDGSSIL